eukprot:scaffold3045_cov271-Chaetoceros_neogracile.AAC.29
MSFRILKNRQLTTFKALIQSFCFLFKQQPGKQTSESKCSCRNIVLQQYSFFTNNNIISLLDYSKQNKYNGKRRTSSQMVAGTGTGGGDFLCYFFHNFFSNSRK